MLEVEEEQLTKELPVRTLFRFLKITGQLTARWRQILTMGLTKVMLVACDVLNVEEAKHQLVLPLWRQLVAELYHVCA